MKIKQIAWAKYRTQTEQTGKKTGTDPAYMYIKNTPERTRKQIGPIHFN